ncbi:MAG TPA: carboxypeptidase regulatory-like domain-containing protein [Polyangiaceae bacterium]
MRPVLGLPPRRSVRHAIRGVRATAAAVAVVLAAGGVPGASSRDVVYDVVAAPPVSDANGAPVRDAWVDVMVHPSTTASEDVDPDAGAFPALVPWEGATVRALSIVDDHAYFAGVWQSGASGHVRLEKLPRGVVWILADAPGRARASTNVIVGPEGRSVDLELRREHVLRVSVNDEVGAPMAQAELEVGASDDPLPIGARTDLSGSASVGRLGSGPWRITARAPGFEDGTGRAERDTDVVAIVLRKLGALSVHVVDAADKPVAAAKVLVGGATLWPARVADADDHGDVRIAGLASGSYALRAKRGDLVSPIELGVALARGEEKPVVLRVAPGRWVAVRVTDGAADDARGIASARVSLAEGGLSPFPLEATTDGSGRARLGPIAPGWATVAAHADGFMPGAVSLPDALPAETRLPLARAGALTGLVVDDRGFPIDGATVEIVGTDPTGAPVFDDPGRLSFQTAHFDAMLAGPAPLIGAGELGVLPGPVPPIPQGAAVGARSSPRAPSEPWVTRDDGTFRAFPASPGRVRAVVHHPQYVESESGMVTLAPGGEAHVDVVMHRGGDLEGRVVDAQGHPVERARVVVASSRGTLERTTRTASDGTFAFAALPDAVSVTASVDDDEDQPDVRMAVTIPELGRREVTLRLPEARGGLAVTVVDDRDWPVDTAQVSASSLSADVPLRATAFSDAHGDAVLKRARGLPLRIEVSAPGHAPKAVMTSGSEDSVRIALVPAESAEGEVIAAIGGQPIPDAQVTLYTGLGVRRARTDGKGAFALRELAPGDGSLRVEAAGFATVSRSLSIPDGAGRRPLDVPAVELVAEGVVEGDVVDARGDAVAGARVAVDHAPTWLAVGPGSEGDAVTDADGRFSLRGLAAGTVSIEAYSPDFGRARQDGVQVSSGRTTSRVRVTMPAKSDQEARPSAPPASGNVAVTLGETAEPVQVVVVSVAAASEAERAGLVPGDILVSVDGVAVHSMEEARDRLGGPVSDDVVVHVRRGDADMGVRVAREMVRR